MSKTSKKPEAGAAAERVTLEVIERNRARRMEFESEEEKQGWEKAFRKSKLYTPYFLLGVLINYLLYRSGLDLSRNILWGMIIGTGIPLASMFLLSELHFKLFIEKNMN
jgi:VanZ family protein